MADVVEPAVVQGGLLEDSGVATASAVLLGFDGDTAWFALDLEVRDGSGSRRAGDIDGLASLGEFSPLGPIEEPIDSESWAVLSQARALLAWNHSMSFCPVCGGTTAAHHGGHQRVCIDPQCGRTYFPRTDPAVIVRVLLDDRCLLARSQRFRPGVRSIIAGFVEPGENLESAVRREVAEEVGLEVEDVRYLGSQSWPFPMSVMIAFEARALTDVIRIDEDEIEAADWYTREDVKRETAAGRLVLSSRKSIARRMVDGWSAGRREI